MNKKVVGAKVVMLPSILNRVKRSHPCKKKLMFI